MKCCSQNRFRFSLWFIFFVSAAFLCTGNISNAFDSPARFVNSSLRISQPQTQTKEYFCLVEARIIDAELLNDQTLDNVSPSLIAPVPVEISPLQYRQQAMQEYHHSVCFKRCHSRNDFYASDYTYEQWSQLIEKDGHSIFCEIPWENNGARKKVLSYLASEAKNSLPDKKGIGIWY